MSNVAKFEFAPGLALEAHERVTEIQLRHIEARMDRLERAMERLEKRLWVAVYGVAAVFIAEGLQSFLAFATQ